MTTPDNQQAIVPIEQPKSADQKHCFSCAKVIHVTAMQCPSCGAMQPSLPISSSSVIETAAKPLPAHHVFCRGCGATLHETAVTCPKCGAPQSAGINVTGNKNRITAALLAIFLGGFGIHKFYLEKILQGFIYLVFCWTFIPAIIGFIEGIIYITMSDADFARKY